MKFDIRGHDIHMVRLENEVSRELQLLGRLEKLCPGGTNEPYPIHPDAYCHKCGDHPSFTESKEEKGTYIAATECAYKEDFPPIEAMLEVPSGEILLFNDFRSCYEEGDPIDINCTLGIKQYTEHYAKQGMIMHFIGNTCASVVKVSDERLEIGLFYCDKEDTCEQDECTASCSDFVEREELGSICTDLWWYCAVDKDAFEKRIGKTVEEYQNEYHATGAWPDIIRAKVTPGTYRTVGQYHIDEDRLFSYIEKVK